MQNMQELKTKRQIRLRTSRGVNWKQKNIQVEKVYTFPLLGKILYTWSLFFPQISDQVNW